MSGLERYRKRCIKSLEEIEFGEGSHENLNKICKAFMKPTFGWSEAECENLRALLIELLDREAFMPCPLDADGVPIKLGDRVTRTYAPCEKPLRVTAIWHWRSYTQITADVIGSTACYTVPPKELRHVAADTPDAILDDLLSRWYDAATPEEEAKLRAEAVRRIEALSE
jgi:hypothetical protein